MENRDKKKYRHKGLRETSVNTMKKSGICSSSIRFNRKRI